MQLKAQLKSNLHGSRKGNIGINAIGDVAIAMGVGIITVALVAMILGVMGDNTTDGNASAVIAKGLTAISSFADWFIILVIVVVAIIVLGLLQYVRNRGGGSA